MRYPPAVETLFWSKVHKTESCWEWNAGIHKTGYGQFNVKGKTIGAHRVAMWITTGAWAKGLILHKCDNRKCVNPSHLYEGTHRDNMGDTMQRRKHHSFKVTHCPKGHEYNEVNSRVHNNNRACRVCDRIRKEKKEWKV